MQPGMFQDYRHAAEKSSAQVCLGKDPNMFSNHPGQSKQDFPLMDKLLLINMKGLKIFLLLAKPVKWN